MPTAYQALAKGPWITETLLFVFLSVRVMRVMRLSVLSPVFQKEFQPVPMEFGT
jgi:hypothetical protein